MEKKRNPYIRVPLAIAVLLMLYYMPTREFLKLTFMLGIPFIALLGLMVKKPRYSWAWNLCAVGLVLVICGYGYQLVHLPQRIQANIIIRNGAVLVTEGRYDEAISIYQQLDELGRSDTMQKKIAVAESEKTAHQQLEYAKELIDSGNLAEARQVLEGIEPHTAAGQEARDVIRTLE